MACITIKKAFALLAAFATLMIFLTSFNPTLSKNTNTKIKQRSDILRQQPKRNLKESMRRAQDTAKKKQKNMPPVLTPEQIEANKQAFLNREWNWDYHKLYPVNCSAIFEGDEEALKESGRLLRLDGRKQNMLPVPSDVRVTTWFQNCTSFKLNRGYPLQPLSKEEKSFPIAYSIVVYKDSAQVERLLRSIYQPQNVYCIHQDNSSTLAFKTAVEKLVACFDNVFIASKLESVEWGAFSAVQADLNCMDDLLRHPVQWKYVLNLCGMDFPLKTNLEMVRQLRAYNGHNCIESYVETRFPNRTKYSNVTGELKDPAPHNITVYKGDTYIAATRGFTNFFVNNPVAKDHMEWLKDTLIPDEYFTSALNKLPYAPGGSPYLGLDCNVRYRKWDHEFKFPERPKCKGRVIHQLCIFRTGYLKHLFRSPHLFVNKLGYDYDPVAMQCLQDMLDYRTVHKEEFNVWKYYNFPVTNFSWQNYTSATYIPGLPAIDLKPWKDPLTKPNIKDPVSDN